MPSASPTLAPHAAASLVELGTRLRARRKGLKISAIAAAEAAGLSRVTLHRIEKGFPSVTAGALAAAAAAIGLRLGLDGGEAPPAAIRRPGWIPARVRLDDFPTLRELAWQVHGTAELTPREALDIYERNQRFVDHATLSDAERDLLDALRVGMGSDAL